MLVLVLNCLIVKVRLSAETSIATDNVGIGTAAPNVPLDVIGDIELTGKLQMNALTVMHMTGNNTNIYLGRAGNLTLTGVDNTMVGTSSGTSLTTGTSNTAVGKFTSYYDQTGTYNVALGTSALQADDTPLVGGDFTADEVYINVADAGAYGLQVGGDAYKTAGTTAWNIPSDGRLKDIHGDYEYGLNEILKIHTVRYNYKENNPIGAPSNKNYVGVIAQEVMSVIPDAVTMNDNGYYALQADAINWAMINAVQELHGMCKMSNEQMTVLDNRLKAVERKVASIEEKTASLEAENAKLRAENAEIKARLDRIEKALLSK